MSLSLRKLLHNPSLRLRLVVGGEDAASVDLDSMVTDRIRLDQVNDAFAEMRQGRGIRSVIEH